MLPNVVLFQGVDSSGYTGLWETNGTAEGTFEITGIAGTLSTGLSPVNLTPLNANEVLFNGTDKSGLAGLWETNGTAAGTHELTGIAGAATTAAGLYPGELTAYNGKALFGGYDASGDVGLWVTDGTVAGTHELAVAGADLWAGLWPSGLTLYNGYVFFAGRDASGAVGLWETDGTASGTHELTDIAGAQTTGSGLDPTDLTVLNSQVLFSGVDLGGHTGLWTTDGTAAGTHQLTGIVGAPTSGAGLDPFYLTVFDGHVLFDGADSKGRGLWETDGTAAGTHELTGIAGAPTTGLYPSDLTVLNGHVLFRGLDSSGQVGLWETDGTVAGTHELTGIAGAQTKGSGLDPTDLTVLNGHVLFSGVDSGGRTGLWTTDGTAAGTHEVTNVGGASTTGLAPSDLTSLATMPVVTAGASLSYVSGGLPVMLDHGLSVTDLEAVSLSAATVSISAGFLSGDALSVGSPQTGIISTYNAATGVLTLSGAASLAAYQAELDSVTYASPRATNSSRTIAWSISDGANTSAPATSHVSVSVPQGDPAGPSPHPSPELSIMLQNTEGQLALWQVNGSTLSAADLLTPNPGASWSEKGVGAFFTGDTSDILLQNANGQVSIWEMNGNNIINGGPVANPGPSWRAVGTGDFNDDKLSDILMQNTSSGQVSVWEMNGNKIMGGGPVADPGPSWRAVGTGDFNDDSHSDILMQNTSSGEVSVWEMNGNKIIDGGPVADPGPSWHAIGTGDFNGDSHSDILMQNTSSGQVSVWEMNGNKIMGGGPVADPGPSWHALGTGGGSSSDILMQNTGGQVSIWDMSGNTIIGGGNVANPGPSWHGIGLT